MTGVQFSFGLLAILVIVALAFDFMNGFHDAVNSIATTVSTGALRPYQAVTWAAFFNFAAIFVFHRHVAETVAHNLVMPNVADAAVIFGTLAGAFVWSVVTWLVRIPTSYSHALIGALLGATIAKAGVSALVTGGLIPIALFILLAPMLAFALSGALVVGASWLLRRAAPVPAETWLRRLQLLSAAFYAMGHGSNNAQKTMGIIWLALIASGEASVDHLPDWVVVSCYGAIALGTLLGGGRIVRTMAQRFTRLKPLGAVSAETGGALTLFMTTWLGIPVSTTHTIIGATMGASATRRFSAARWGVAGNILLAWGLTIPASAVLAGLGWWLGRFVFP